LDNQFSVATVFIYGLSLVALYFYTRMALWLRRAGGAVNDGGFVAADLSIGLVLATFFGYFAISNWPDPKMPPAPVKVEDVLPGELFMIVIALGVGGFLVYRGANLVSLLGLKRLPPLRIVGSAIAYILAAFPIIVALAKALTGFLDHEPEEQQLVILFRDEARHGHFRGVATILLAGVILAPCVEEFLFRGFFYGVFKRHFGGIGAGLFSAALFAVFHMNMASLPGLFVLALCLTLAYERTGSLFVPVAMHALFNFSNLALLYLQALGYFH